MAASSSSGRRQAEQVRAGVDREQPPGQAAQQEDDPEILQGRAAVVPDQRQDHQERGRRQQQGQVLVGPQVGGQADHQQRAVPQPAPQPALPGAPAPQAGKRELAVARQEGRAGAGQQEVDPSLPPTFVAGWRQALSTIEVGRGIPFPAVWGPRAPMLKLHQGASARELRLSCWIPLSI